MLRCPASRLHLTLQWQTTSITSSARPPVLRVWSGQCGCDMTGCQSVTTSHDEERCRTAEHSRGPRRTLSESCKLVDIYIRVSQSRYILQLSCWQLCPNDCPHSQSCYEDGTYLDLSKHLIPASRQLSAVSLLLNPFGARVCHYHLVKEIDKSNFWLNRWV